MSLFIDLDFHVGDMVGKIDCDGGEKLKICQGKYTWAIYCV